MRYAVALAALPKGAVTCGRFLTLKPTLSHRPTAEPGGSGDLGSISRRQTDAKSPPPGRRRLMRYAVALAALLLALTACSSDSDEPGRGAVT